MNILLAVKELNECMWSTSNLPSERRAYLDEGWSFEVIAQSVVSEWSCGIPPASLTLSVDAARAGASGYEFFHQRQKECLAKPAEWRLRLEIE
jgi:hypothetical protein